MIAFLEGTVEYIEESVAVINRGGIGFHVYMTPAALSSLSRGDTVRVFTYLRVAEDLMKLYGFLTREEIDMFKLLISVSGAGPKAALSVLSALSPAQVTVSVITDDYKSITRANGVGPKLAQKIVLELKDKLKGKELNLEGGAALYETGTQSANDALEALVALGYSRAEAVRALSSVSNDLSTEDRIKAALIRLMK